MKSSEKNNIEAKQSNQRKGAHRIKSWWIISVLAILGLPAPCWSQFKEPVLTGITNGTNQDWAPTFSSDMLEVYWTAKGNPPPRTFGGLAEKALTLRGRIRNRSILLTRAMSTVAPT